MVSRTTSKAQRVVHSLNRIHTCATCESGCLTPIGLRISNMISTSRLTKMLDSGTHIVVLTPQRSRRACTLRAATSRHCNLACSIDLLHGRRRCQCKEPDELAMGDPLWPRNCVGNASCELNSCDTCEAASG